MAAPPRFTFEAVPNIFEQSLPETAWESFDYTKNNMGLIAQGASLTGAGCTSDKPWPRLLQYIDHLRSVAPPGVQYKLIINGRHGEGYHNVAQREHGEKAWDETYSKLHDLDGHDLLDARLTPIGEEQARTAGACLQRQIHEQGLPAPESYYVSPLLRCLQTAHLTWQSVSLPADRPFKPVVKEMLREALGEHTCDKRSSRTVMLQAYPDISIEDGFAEEDLLWQAHHRETHSEHNVRTQALLDDVFTNNPASIISFTSHSGSITSLLRVLGNRWFPLQTGALIPLLVKATKVV